MTIKHLGGIFGRNPTFNDVTIEGQLTFDGDIDINSDLKIDGDLEVTGTSKLTGNVGVGKSSGSNALEVQGESLFGDGTDGIKLTYSGGSSTGIIDTGYTSTGLEFRVGNVKKLILNSSGNLEMNSGSGIDFSATAQAPGMTSELLDDYEEGVWTADLTMTSGSVGYGAQAGKYVKVGNQVTATAWIYINSVSSPAGALSITLPFTTSFSTARTGTFIRNGNLTGVTGQTTGWLNPGTAILYLSQADNGAGSSLDGANLQIGTELYISITYIV